jgi:hypothetical protein
MTATFVDPLAAFRESLLALAPSTALASVAVRTNVKHADDVPPFVVIAEGGAIRHRTGPAYAPARVNFSAWGIDADQAVELYLTASQLLHRLGPLVRNGAGIFRIYDETGVQQPFEDPDTGWWRAFGVFDLVMVDRPVS